MIHRCNANAKLDLLTSDNSDGVKKPGMAPEWAQTKNADDNKLSGRKESMKMFNVCMPEMFLNDKGKSTLLDGNFKIQRNIVDDHHRKKKMAIFKSMAQRLRYNFGLRHFFLVGLLAIYALLGGLTFQALEKDHEHESLRKNKEALELMIERMATNITILLEVQPSPELKKGLQLLIRQHYQTMLKIEGKYIGSVFHKYEQMVVRFTWYFGSSVFYAMTLFTTIGYGTIVCHTTLGRIVSIFYAMFGIPLMLVVLSDLGQLILRFFIFCHNWLHHSCRSFLRSMACRILDMEEAAVVNVATERQKIVWTTKESIEVGSIGSCVSGGEDGVEEEEDQCPRGFPLSLSVPIVLLYLAFVSLLISTFDHPNPYSDIDGRGLSFLEAFYFVFISLSTIGLGDLMPNCSNEFSPFLDILLLFGLALLSVVNSTMYLAIQRYFLAAIEYLEELLETRPSTDQHERQEGYFVFRSLAPNIQLLALALPIFHDASDDQIGAMLEPADTSFRRRVFSVSPSPLLSATSRLNSYSRTYSTSADDRQQEQQSAGSHRQCYHTVHGSGATPFFHPTLGILNTEIPSRKGTLICHDKKPNASPRGSADPLMAMGRRRAVTVAHLGNLRGKAEADRGKGCRRTRSSLRKRKPMKQPMGAEDEAVQQGGEPVQKRMKEEEETPRTSSSKSKLRRAQSERAPNPERQQQRELYVIDEVESQQQQQTVCCGERRLQQRTRQQSPQAESQSPHRTERLLDRLGQRTFSEHKG